MQVVVVETRITEDEQEKMDVESGVSFKLIIIKYYKIP